MQNVLSGIAKAVFGPDIKYRFNKDTFPYTDPSLEMEVEIGGRWIKVLSCGIMTDTIIKNLGLDPNEWSNWLSIRTRKTRDNQYGFTRYSPTLV